MPDRESRRVGWRRRRGLVFWVLVGAWIALSAARPVYGPGPAYPPGPVAVEKLRFAFDLPPGWWAEKAPDLDEYWIGPKDAGIAITLEAISPYRFYEPLSDPSDSLLSFVKQNLGGVRCDAMGDRGEIFADSLVALRTFRTREGFAVVEYSVRVVEERWSGGYDEADTTAQIATPAEAEPVTVSRSSHLAGPFYVADLSRPGRRLLVRISPDCSEPAGRDVVKLARSLVRSLRHI